MLSGIVGRKIGMTHLFDEEGRMVPVSVIQAGPVYVTQIKTKEKDGYDAIQVGFQETKSKKLKFPEIGHLKKAGVGPLKVLREFRGNSSQVQLGQKITVEIFQPGEKVKVVGRSKGRGFAGAVKRYGFSGQFMTHGSMTHRRPLSSGATGPQRVFKGMRRPGHMGDVRVTQIGLKVVKVDPDKNLLLVSGSVPGANGSIVEIHKVEGKV
ncbi:MAG TPA: 50S ribosomal protein L3 [Fimbriimonadales bacterium]|nr:50S ribosomal protein L3 [Fimbriimonadales bacterium]